MFRYNTGIKEVVKALDEAYKEAMSDPIILKMYYKEDYEAKLIKRILGK